MAKFNWEDFCRSHRIEYVTEGPSSTPGNINITCPFCGPSDPGHHMGLHLKTGSWHCWRNPESHAGKKPERLIMRLIGCGPAEAAQIVGEAQITLEGFEAAAAQFLAEGEAEGPERVLSLPEEFRPLKNRKGRARMYFDYLVRRGFDDFDIEGLHVEYDLHYCDRGTWRGRIILPIYYKGKLVSWTGRTVYDKEKIRYKSLSHKPDAMPRGLMSVKEVLYNYDNVMEGRIHSKWDACVLVEGPLDVLKLDFFGVDYNTCAVAPLGSGISSDQLDQLVRISRVCKRMYICGDQGADSNVMRLKSSTTLLDLKELKLPPRVEDPGALSYKQVSRLLAEI